MPYLSALEMSHNKALYKCTDTTTTTHMLLRVHLYYYYNHKCRWRKVVCGGRGWLADDTDGVAGWPVTVGVIKVGVSASQEQTLSGIGARVYTAHRGWLGVVTGISAVSTGGVLV